MIDSSKSQFKAHVVSLPNKPEDLWLLKTYQQQPLTFAAEYDYNHRCKHLLKNQSGRNGHTKTRVF